MKRCLIAIVCFAHAGASLCGAIITTSPDLPPEGYYLSFDDIVFTGPGITFEDIKLTPIPPIVRTPSGNDEEADFGAELEVNETEEGLGPITLTGPVEILTTDRLLSTTGTFDAEIVSLNLAATVSGYGDILIRESPTLSSLGESTVADIGGGQFSVDSFFDVFFEISIDGGSNWDPADSSVQVTAFPEPATGGLIAGMCCLAWIALRRRE